MRERRAKESQVEATRLGEERAGDRETSAIYRQEVTLAGPKTCAKAREISHLSLRVCERHPLGPASRETAKIWHSTWCSLAGHFCTARAYPVTPSSLLNKVGCTPWAWLKADPAYQMHPSLPA